jgi:curved DNA-binding protein CbpA
MSKDYYAVLGVSRDANLATIHSAFRALARQYHPDAGRESSSTKFREVLEAYQTLSDSSLRRQHDIDLGRTLHAQYVPAEPLFASHPVRSRSMQTAPLEWDELLTDLLRFIDSEFEISLRFRRTFFY